jgi:hypothetical protein
MKKSGLRDEGGSSANAKADGKSECPKTETSASTGCLGIHHIYEQKLTPEVDHGYKEEHFCCKQL